MRTENIEDGKVEIELKLPVELIDRAEAYCQTHGISFDEVIEQAMDGLMTATERDRHVLRLLELQAQYSRKVDQLDDLGIILDTSFEVISYNLLHPALDMLGVPEDNSDKWEGTEGESEPPDWYFCRDGFTERFFETMTEDSFTQRFTYVQWIRQWVEERSELTAETIRGGNPGAQAPSLKARKRRRERPACKRPSTS